MSTVHDSTDSAQSQEELLQALVESATDQTDLLVTLGKQAETFVSLEGEPYARVEVYGVAEPYVSADGETATAGTVATRHRETLDWQNFEYWLTRTYHTGTGQVVKGTALTNAMRTLEALARERKRAVYTRIAGVNGKLYIDLCDQHWRVIEVDKDGWRVRPDSPVPFRREPGMEELPVPEDGGTVDELRPFLNLAPPVEILSLHTLTSAPVDMDFLVIVGWLLGALHPTGPHPLLVLDGEQGSGKSKLMTMLRMLVDPSTSAPPNKVKDSHNLAITARNSYVVCFDNLSALPQWLSDDLCCLAEGGGFRTRTLYKNTQQTLFQAHRPIILGGITEVATSADLLSRALLVTLPAFDEKNRKSESELFTAFRTARPRILGALLTVVSAAMRAPTANLKTEARLKDFEVWMRSAEPALGWKPGTFSAVYSYNRSLSVDMQLDVYPEMTVLLRMMATEYKHKPLVMTAEDLRAELVRKAPIEATRSPEWPKKAQVLANHLVRVKHTLRQRGIVAERSGDTAHGRLWTITHAGVTRRQEPEPEVNVEDLFPALDLPPADSTPHVEVEYPPLVATRQESASWFFAHMPPAE